MSITNSQMHLTAATCGARSQERPRSRWPAKCDVLGVGITPTNYDEAVAVILDAAARGGGGTVSCFAVHALMTASRDRRLREMANGFDMITPDGQPVRWALNWVHGARLKDRVYGPELTLRLCRGAAQVGLPIYLYGGTEQVVRVLADNLVGRFPRLQIAGAESPPFRQLTPEEDCAMVQRVNGSGARLMFIGLGCPKQDIFAHQHKEAIRAVQVCVGAAFDFHAGVKKIAPLWMQRHGLEWLYRLSQEPRRLWKRYLVTNTQYLTSLAAALLWPAAPEPSATPPDDSECQTN